MVKAQMSFWCVEREITFRNVRKVFGQKEALAGIDITFRPFEIHSILGPNGSGKTTMLRIIGGLSSQTSGDVSVLGFSPMAQKAEIRKICGFVEENPSIYNSMTLREYVGFLISMRGLEFDVAWKRAESLISGFSLGEYYDSLIGSFSFGTRQKAAIVGSLIHDPKVIVMDEAYKGLDPHSFTLLKRLLKSFSQEGRIVIFSTHILEIAESLCDRMSILYNGRIIFSDSVSSFSRLASEEGLSGEDMFIRLTGGSDMSSVQEDVMRNFNDSGN
jgi:ABC-2 type transport system ATP-binding protein